MSCNGKAETLMVVVAGYNIREQIRSISTRSQRVDFFVETGDLKIREAVVETRR